MEENIDEGDRLKVSDNNDKVSYGKYAFKAFGRNIVYWNVEKGKKTLKILLLPIIDVKNEWPPPELQPRPIPML